VIELLKTLIHETEATGAGDIVPHGALLRGEALEPLRIRNKATLTGGELKVRVYSNTTLWELKKALAGVLDYTPRYLRISLGGGTQLTDFKDADNGKTMKALGLAGGELLTASRHSPDDFVEAAALIDVRGELTPAARRVFCHWFEMFREADGTWSKESAGYFVQGCCGEPPGPTDTRVVTLFQQYDKDGDGKIKLKDFLTFYATASRGDKPAVVRDNLKAFNVRPDLVKWSDLGEQASTAVADLPRRFMSRNQAHFDQLMSLLDQQNEEVTKEAWDLVQMLATNQAFYRQVLNLDIAKQGAIGNVDWARCFDRSSSYRLLYTLQIVQAVLEDGRSGTSRATVLNPDDFPTNRVSAASPAKRAAPIPGVPAPEIDQAQMEEAAVQPLKKQMSQIADTEQEEVALRGQWAEEFLTQGGFQYILKDFMECQLAVKVEDAGQQSE